MKTYQIAGIGNAIVDVISTVDDRFLERMDIHKAIMQLIDRNRAETLFAAMEGREQASGGSVANTLAGAGALGLRAAFVGRVNDDELGRFYAQDSDKVGAKFVNAPVAGGDLPTSRSMIFVTPDGERSMNTYLGMSAELGPDDVDETCRSTGGMAGIALSDPFCVDRHRADFRKLVAEDMDYVIGNEQEWVSLYQANDLEDALAGVRVDIPVHTVTPVDATGAGDQFAAGFLFGLAQGRDMETAGRMGCIAAAEVIGHIGARPKTDLRAAFRAAGLLAD